jgi:hypothetical protein
MATAPVNVYSKTYWTGFIAAVSEEAAYELGLHDKINPEALRQSTKRGWRASLFTPNILRHTDVYVDQSTNFDFSSHRTTHVAAASLAEPTTKEGRKAKKTKEEEENLEKYKWLGPLIASAGAFLTTYTWTGYQRCKATHDHTALVLSHLQTQLDPQWTPLKPQLARIVSIKRHVDEIRYKILKRYFYACAGILVGGALLTMGAYTKQPQLIPWGQIALATAAIWTAASAGLQWQDNKEIRNLYRLIVLGLADNALSQLFNNYQEGMILQPQAYYQDFPPSTYQPFFFSHAHAKAYQAPPPSFNPAYDPNAAYPPSAPYLYE